MTDKKVIFDLEIYLENGKYKHNYNVDVPDKGGLFHLLFIAYTLERTRKEIHEIDIGKMEYDWKNVDSS